jgi:hypothetical protein
MITELKIHLEEDKIIEESLRGQLDENDRIIEGLEVEIVTLKKYLQKKDMHKKKTRILDDIINIQIPYYDRFGLGYN